MTRLYSGQERDAIADCDKAVKIRPDDSGLTEQRGLVHLKLKRIDEALADFERALQLDPHSAYSLFGRGITKLQKGNASGWADVKKAMEAEISAALNNALIRQEP
jgi:tetratricopeptide (TPR) repeat protein